MTRLGPFEGKSQPTPPVGDERLRECQWETCTTLEIPKDWLSGVYLGKLSATKHRYQSYVIFIVRDDRPADFLFQCSDNTWQAYNQWPDNYSLYTNDRKDKQAARLRRAGQLRPALRQVRADLRQPAVAGLRRVPAVGVPARLLDGAARLRRDLLLQRGRPRRPEDAVRGRRRSCRSGTTNTGAASSSTTCMAAVKAGVNVGFFSGNTCCFVTPFSPSSTACRTASSRGPAGTAASARARSSGWPTCPSRRRTRRR